MVMPDVLLVENYRTHGALGLCDTILAIGTALSRLGLRHLPVRQTFRDPARAR